MAKLFDIQETTVAISNLTLDQTQGTVTHTGDVTLTGNLGVAYNLVVGGSITADTFNVKNLVTANGSLGSVGNWTYNTESELLGKGFSWTHGTGSTQLIYRDGGRLWTNGTVDLAAGLAYNIDNIPVLTATALGPTVTSSNLTRVGTLASLTVSGDTVLGEFAFFNSTYNRFGIGTEEPNGAIGILENNVEIVLGSPEYNLGYIGTYSSHDLTLGTDNLARITIKNSGEVNIGDPVNGGGSLNVYGTLTATSIVTDNRIDRTHPLTFSATNETSTYGLGLQWVGTGSNKQFILMGNPDRIMSSENLELGPDKAYYINGKMVLTDSNLGPSVLNSQLVTVGTLNTLSVQGESHFQNTIYGTSMLFNDGVSTIIYDKTGITSTNSFSISAKNQIVYGDGDQISIGDNKNLTLPVKVFGKLSVGINNPDPTLNFSVNGDVSIGGKRFTNGVEAPSTGVHTVGDICWNSNPQANSAIGWVCITTGTPGQWLPFGTIAAQ